jgi:hypothetical protein
MTTSPARSVALALEVLRCVMRKSQGIQFSSEELKQADEILGDLIEQYQPPLPPSR